ncbi:hypothetical protein UWK_03602 (plasmid) [Desulfocapsa sulfexigens DSM 10523]|uniref:Uncharacterized protein n=1 Tax=Desulfocapsa sulfexigens (strain DSM 10523 / SB164P1) TaxID=1167006 RepID=M1PUV7_DESSD|nr:hypothetical protein [Desulfocapsa sulfexigens]AGF80111.1 hypothetical protein UWK_03602 [Desulfocapsa sulfexigens DSM 10523]
MCRGDVEISCNDYDELLKWATKWNKDLAQSIEQIRIVKNNKEGHKTVFLRKEDITKEEAEAFLESLMESEIYAYDEKSLKYFSHLVEAWRPLAEE